MSGHKRGFTSVELIVGLIVGAILVLMIGAISSIGNASFDKAVNESSFYNDAFSGINRIMFLGRKAYEINISNTPDSNWKSQILELDNRAFGLYQPDGAKIDFVFLNDKADLSQRDILVDDADSLTLNLVQSGRMVTVTLQGQKGKESINLSTSVMMRNNN